MCVYEIYGINKPLKKFPTRDFLEQTGTFGFARVCVYLLNFGSSTIWTSEDGISPRWIFYVGVERWIFNFVVVFFYRFVVDCNVEATLLRFKLTTFFTS